MSRSLTSITVSEANPAKRRTNKDTTVFVRSQTSDSSSGSSTAMKQDPEPKKDENGSQGSTISSKSCGENCQRTGATTNKCSCRRVKLPYQQLMWTMENDSRWKAERSQGRIVGMYKVLGEIGSGNFAKVKLGIHQLTKEKVAVKIIDKSRIEPKMEKMLSREVATMESMSHRNLIRLFEVVETTNRVYLISEWAPAGDLYSKVTLKGLLSETEAKPIFQQILAAVTYMHAHEIIHRDLKAENVFFLSTTSLKVGDFGFSTSARNGRQLTTFCGSPPYAAPELFRDESYEGWAVDVWALGVLIFFMVEGNLPFIGSSIPALKKAILNGNYSTSEHLSHECVSLISSILCQKASQRLTLSKIIRHPWLASVSSPAEIEKMEGVRRIKDDTPSPVQHQMRGRRGEFQTLNRQDTLNLLLPKQKPLSKTIPTQEQLNFGLLSSQEEQALKLLVQVVGVDQRLIDAHRSAGVRSHVVGIYRIILHRLQQGYVWSPKDFAVPECYATSNACAIARKHSKNNSTKKGQMRASGLVAHITSTGMALVPSGGGNGKSKSVQSNTCTLL